MIHMISKACDWWGLSSHIKVNPLQIKKFKLTEHTLSMTKTSSEGFFSRFTLANFCRRKPIEKSLSEETTERTLTLVDLTMYGIAATVGSGIYSIVGKVARGRVLDSTETIYIDSLGPGVIYSIGIAGGLSLLTSICYLEFASALPISGSGYAYFYSMVGEFLGWFIGWNLTLEYAFAAAAVAGKWSIGLQALVNPWLPQSLEWVFNYPIIKDNHIRLNLIAPALILFLGLIVNRGVSMGSRFTNAATILNLSLICFIILVGCFYVDTSRWAPFIMDIDSSVVLKPEEVLSPFSRVLSGASEMFFCFIGYDTVSTLSTDAINPARDIPIAAFLTIGTATLLYSLIGLVLTGIVANYADIRGDIPVLSVAFEKVGAVKSAHIVNIVSLMNMAVTVFACLLGQPKIFAAISRDGLLPKGLARENSRGVHSRSVLATLILTAGVAAIYDVDTGIIDMIAAGCLLSMSIVCTGMLACRFNNAPSQTRSYGHSATIAYFFSSMFACWAFMHEKPFAVKSASLLLTAIPLCALIALFLTRSNQLKPLSASAAIKSFVCPMMPLVPCLAIAANNYVFVSIPWAQIRLFLAWAIIGISVYLGYGLHHSKLGQEIEAVKSFGKF